MVITTKLRETTLDSKLSVIVVILYQDNGANKFFPTRERSGRFAFSRLKTRCTWRDPMRKHRRWVPFCSTLQVHFHNKKKESIAIKTRVSKLAFTCKPISVCARHRHLCFGDDYVLNYAHAHQTNIIYSCRILRENVALYTVIHLAGKEELMAAFMFLH